jgi:hypothetical protein
MEAPGKSPCPDQRDRLIAVATGEARRDFALDAHLARCGGCRAWLGRVELQIGALRKLPRMSAPRALEGRAVAATQAGFRQDRVVETLRKITPVTMPIDVDCTIWPVGKTAPPVLDRLVDQDLQEQTRGIARRFAGRIERLSAPRTLDARVKSVWSSTGTRSSQRRWIALAAAVLLVVLSVTGTLWFVGRQRPIDLPNLASKGGVQGDGAPTVPDGRPDPSRAVDSGRPEFIIQRVSSPADLDPALQHAFALVLGGAPDAQEKPW